MAGEWVEVFTAADQVEAELTRGLLEASGIPVVVEAHGTQALPFLFGPARVGGELAVRVPPDREAEAREILATRAAEEDGEQEP